MGRRVLQGLVVAGWLIGQSSPAVGQSASDVMILGDIGGFKCIGARAPGGKTGVVGGAGHFPPGSGTMYTISCDNDALDLGVDVQVTLHSSPQWLGHEAEATFRDGLGMPDDVFAVRQIDGNHVLVFGSAGWTYQWISGGKTVVRIEYHDSQMTKPEPLEIVRAYLLKYPSSLPAMTSVDLRTDANKTKWVTDEMERRVWLMEKWVSVGSADVLKQAEAMRTILSHVEVFARYRQKYLGEDPVPLMQAFYTAAGGGGGSITPENWLKLTAEVSKLRTWWDSNKTRPLLISGLPSGFRLAEGWPVLLGGLGAARELWVNRGRVSGAIGRWLTKER